MRSNGFGKPFVDVIIKSSEKFKDHYIRLKINCRQENDETILELGDIFGDKSQFYEEILDKKSNRGPISLGLNVELWKDKEELNSKIDECLLREIQDEPSENDHTGPANLEH